MTKADIAALVAEKGLTKKQAMEAVEATLEIIKQALNTGEKIQLVGFGSFQVKAKRARKGRNPQTGSENHHHCPEGVEVQAGQSPAPDRERRELERVMARPPRGDDLSTGLAPVRERVLPPPPESQPEVPDRLYFRIGDVSSITGVPPYVLRYWESEVPRPASHARVVVDSVYIASEM